MTAVKERAQTRNTGRIFIEWFDPDVPSSFDVELDEVICAYALRHGSLAGHCNVCGQPARFEITSHVLRENVVCPHDACIGRYRSITAALSQVYFGHCDADLRSTVEHLSRGNQSVYLTETNTSIFRCFTTWMPSATLTVSEFIGDAYTSGDIVDGLQHEDLERTSFHAGAFDLIITSEVMEHVPDALAAEREIVRILRPGGRYLFTVPLDPLGPADIVLSERKPDGTIVHIGEPVYHGDPKRANGILAFRIFALRSLAERFIDLGCTFETYRVWSKTSGILGDNCWVHVVKKAMR